MAQEIIQTIRARDMFPVSTIQVTPHALASFQERLGVGLADAASLIRERFAQATFSGESSVRRGSRRGHTFHFDDNEANITFVVERTKRGYPQLRTIRSPQPINS